MVDAEKIKSMFNGEKVKPLILFAETYVEFQVWCWDHEISPHHPLVTFIGSSWHDLDRLRRPGQPLYAVSSWPRWSTAVLQAVSGCLQALRAIELQGDDLTLWLSAADDQRPGLRRHVPRSWP